MKNTSPPSGPKCLVCLLIALAGLVAESHAALRTWDGAVDTWWANRTNWTTDVAPVAGDDLLFPPTALGWFLNSNNLPAGTTFRSIGISGINYELRGASISVNAGITNIAAAANQIQLPLVLNSNQTVNCVSNSGLLQFTAQIDTAGRVLTLVGPGKIDLLGPVTGSGSIIINKTGNNFSLVSGANTYSGLTEVRQGKLAVGHNNGLGMATAGTTVLPSGTLALSTSGGVVVAEPLTLWGKLSGGGASNTWSGPITLMSNTPSVESGTGGLIISGEISGTGSVSVVSSGINRFTGNNTYTGPTTIQGGTLLINGNQPFSPIFHNSGTFGGTGTVGSLNCVGFGQTVSPGDSGPGRLTTGNLLFNSETILVAQLNGTAPGTGHDQLRVLGVVDLANATLNATKGFTPAGPTPLVLIDNDGFDAIVGTFNGLFEGAVLNLGGTDFTISYVGGTGNDVVLRPNVVATEIAFESITRSGDGQIQLVATGGVPSSAYALEAASNLSVPTFWGTIGTGVANGSGQILFTDSEAPLVPMRFYRARAP